MNCWAGSFAATPGQNDPQCAAMGASNRLFPNFLAPLSYLPSMYRTPDVTSSGDAAYRYIPGSDLVAHRFLTTIDNFNLDGDIHSDYGGNYIVDPSWDYGAWSRQSSAPNCQSPSLSPLTYSADAKGGMSGPNLFTVTTTATCSWNLIASASWLSVFNLPPTRKGSATFGISTSPNVGATRTGSVSALSPVITPAPDFRYPGSISQTPIGSDSQIIVRQ